jgi:hypothetical protein
MPLKTPRLSLRLVRAAKKPATALSQLAEVGAKWNVPRGCRPGHPAPESGTSRLRRVRQRVPADQRRARLCRGPWWRAWIVRQFKSASAARGQAVVAPSALNRG